MNNLVSTAQAYLAKFTTYFPKFWIEHLELEDFNSTIVLEAFANPTNWRVSEYIADKSLNPNYWDMFTKQAIPKDETMFDEIMQINVMGNIKLIRIVIDGVGNAHIADLSPELS